MTIFLVIRNLIKLDHTSITFLFQEQRIPCTARIVNFSKKKEAVIDLADNYSLESQEANNNIVSILSNKSSFLKSTRTILRIEYDHTISSNSVTGRQK